MSDVRVTMGDVRAAAADVVAWYETVKGYGGGWGDLAHKILACAHNVLAEYPTDDGEPWDTTWLHALPGMRTYGNDPVLHCYVRFGREGRVEFFRDGRVRLNGTAIVCPTRGRVRRLVEALSGG